MIHHHHGTDGSTLRHDHAGPDSHRHKLYWRNQRNNLEAIDYCNAQHTHPKGKRDVSNVERSDT